MTCVSVVLPGSKSITNRALILASLASGKSILHHVLLSEDTRAMITGLRTLGVSIALDEISSTCVIQGVNTPFLHQTAVIDCRESGTMLRFMLAVCASSPGDYTFTGASRLFDRPVGPLLEVLKTQGVTIARQNESQLILKSLSQLIGGEIHIDASESSQFISALLLSAPFAENNVVLHVNALASAPYVNMTIKMMRQFGVITDVGNGNFCVRVPQRYVAQDYVIEPDLSSASYVFAAAALAGKEVFVERVVRDCSLQGDVDFLTVLERMGCHVVQSKKGVLVKGPEILRGIDVDMNAIPDTFMTLAAMAPFANAPTTMKGIAHTRKKESDRIEAMSTNLKRLGIHVETGDDWMRVYPGKPLAGSIDPMNDHRIAMSCALLGLKVPGIEIQDKACVNKSFPGFFGVLEKFEKY